jgi:hypothetical protein
MDQQEEQQVEEYAAYIEDERKFLSDNRQRVAEFKKELPIKAAEVLKKIGMKILMVNADSDPNKSHWAIAQCREVLAHWDRDLGILEKFETAEKRVASYDQANRE